MNNALALIPPGLLDQKLASERAYWLKQLSGDLAVTGIPLDFRRPDAFCVDRDSVIVSLDPEIMQKLIRMCDNRHSLIFAVLETALVICLHKYTGVEDIIVGTTIHEEHRDIAPLNNVLALRNSINGRLTIRTLLNQVKRNISEAYSNQRYPLDAVMDLLNIEYPDNRAPLFNIALILENINKRENIAHLKHDALLQFAVKDGRTTGAVEYNPTLYKRETIEAFVKHYVEVLRTVVSLPERRVAELSLLDQAEWDQIVLEWNDTDSKYPDQACVHQLIEGQVQLTPDAMAVTFEEQQLSYRELNSRANQLAWYLRGLGVGPDVLVGMCMERCVEMVVGLLGILKAGGAYVPLDPSHPVDRLRYMWEDCNLVAVLTQRHLKGLFSDRGNSLAVLDLMDRDCVWQDQPESDPDPDAIGLTPSHLAYVIYTSGSTGQPKGVMVHHRGIVRLVRNTDYVQLGPDDVVAQASTASFDAATFEIWGALLAGGRLVGISKNALLSPALIIKDLQQHKITTLFLTTALFNQIARDGVEAFANLRYLLFGGEQVEPRWVARVLREGRCQHLLHVYGPTETVTYATWHEVRTVEDGRTVGIGRPIANTRIYILDGHRQPVPAGVAGELYVGGAGVARGYLNRPELTAERFVKDPYVEEPGARMYKTGDVGRRLADGTIEFVGRCDFQVKIRGFRIELGEIETAIAAHPAVREAVVIAREDEPGEKRLVAYVVVREELPISELQAFLRHKLPDYMAPAAFVTLETMPLTANGKLDRRALPTPASVRLDLEADYEAPGTEIERTIAGVWQELLHVEAVGLGNNFFDLGANSLMVARAHAKMQQAFGKDIPIVALLQYPTIRSLAVYLSQPPADETQFQSRSRAQIRRATNLRNRQVIRRPLTATEGNLNE
jgi:amino acid adenylation domain-containing protein